ncbi:MAG: hypothetical protein HYX24_04285 [Candidatus Aenigmarchaeota archaeon]|nr:hypothetical protein [Candidatus Aenigmarchaeota archaeon]
MKSFWILAAAFILLSIGTASATIVIRTADIEVMYDEKLIEDPIFYSIQLICYRQLLTIEDNLQRPHFTNFSLFDPERNCYWQPLGEEIDCTSSHCGLSRLSGQYRVAVYSTHIEKTLVTDTLETKKRYTKLEINFNPDGTSTVKETTPLLQTDEFRQSVGYFWLIFISQMLIAFFYAKKMRQKKVCFTVVLATLMFVPVFLLLSWLSIPIVFLAFAIIETLIIYLLNKKTLTIKDAFFFSTVANIMSLLFLGLLLSII